MDDGRIVGHVGRQSKARIEWYPCVRAVLLVPSPPSSGERVRVRGPSGEITSTKREAKSEEEPLTLALSPPRRGARGPEKRQDKKSIT